MKRQMKYYDKKEGGKEISLWEFMEQKGIIDRMKQNGITINPTHSCELLKKTRLEIFEKVKQNFIEERKIKKLLTFFLRLLKKFILWLFRISSFNEVVNFQFSKTRKIHRILP